MKYLAILAIAASFILAGCLQQSQPLPETGTSSSGSGSWANFWSDRYINFPIINATANYTGNETSIAGIYGTIKSFTVFNFINNTNATVILKNEVGVPIVNATVLGASTVQSFTNRTVAYENYGQVTLNVTCRSCAVRIVVKHT